MTEKVVTRWKMRQSGSGVKNRLVARMWDGHAKNVDSQGKDNLVSFPWLPWRDSKITKISYWVSFKIYCVCLYVQYLARFFREQDSFVTNPQALWQRNMKRHSCQDPRESNQTVQVVNLLRIKTSLFPSSLTKIYFSLICYRPNGKSMTWLGFTKWGSPGSLNKVNPAKRKPFSHTVCQNWNLEKNWPRA